MKQICAHSATLSDELQKMRAERIRRAECEFKDHLIDDFGVTPAEADELLHVLFEIAESTVTSQTQPPLPENCPHPQQSESADK
jgi:hypothetical protein